MAELQARWHGSIAEIPEDQWQAVTAAAGLPFYSWPWLERLEASGSIVPSQGWQPVHLGLWRGASLVAVAPLYVKGHSYGEFVFDQAFAQLAGQLARHRQGVRYRSLLPTTEEAARPPSQRRAGRRGVREAARATAAGERSALSGRKTLDPRRFARGSREHRSAAQVASPALQASTLPPQRRQQRKERV